MCWLCFCDVFLTLFRLLPLLGWADPGGSAIPSQPVARTEQAPIPWPRFKNQFNIQATQWVAFQILSWKEQILHMILAKRPRSDGDIASREWTGIKSFTRCPSWHSWLNMRQMIGIDKKPGQIFFLGDKFWGENVFFCWKMDLKCRERKGMREMAIILIGMWILQPIRASALVS